MKVLIILIIIMVGAPMVYNFPTLLFLLAPAVFFIIDSDKAGAAIEGFFAIGFALMLIVGAYNIFNTIF